MSGVHFLQKVSLRSVFKAKTESPDVNSLQKVSLRSICDASTEPSGVNSCKSIFKEYL